jgi:hypothetical protein
MNAETIYLSKVLRDEVCELITNAILENESKECLDLECAEDSFTASFGSDSEGQIEFTSVEYWDKEGNLFQLENNELEGLSELCSAIK